MKEGYFTPFNRYLTVDLIEEKEKEDSLVVLPNDYEKIVSPLAKVVVIEIADDSKLKGKLKINDTIIVERRMLNKVDINEYSFYLILENYIYGRITDENN